MSRLSLRYTVALECVHYIKYLSILRLMCASSPTLITEEERAISSTQRRLAAAAAAPRAARRACPRAAGTVGTDKGTRGAHMCAPSWREIIVARW